MATQTNKGFSVKFNTTSQSFAPKFTKTKTDFPTDVKPQAKTAEEVYYDEIIFYDGGGVEGYGDDS